MINQNNLINAQMRSFAKKKKASKEAVTTDEEEAVAEEVVEEPVKATPAPPKASPAATSVDFSAAGNMGEK